MSMNKADVLVKYEMGFPHVDAVLSNTPSVQSFATNALLTANCGILHGIFTI